MADSVAVVAVVVVVAGVAGAAPVASSVGPSGTAAQETPVNDSAVAPGERMAGVVGAEQAAVESEVALRAFERRVAVANSSTAKAEVVGAEVEDIQARLDELADREAELRRAHENGTLSTGEYRARLAQLYAEQRALQRLANRTERVARGLPEQALRQQGVNVTAIRTLQSRARNLTGPEVAEIARSIAGKSVGRPAGAGPPEFVENRTGGPGAGNGPPGEGGPPDNRSGGPGNGTGPPENAGDGASEAGNGTGPPGNETGANGNGQGNGNAADPAGNETGPPGNGTGPPEDAGNGTETGPPEQSGGPNGNQTGGPDQGQGPPGNETGQPDGGQGEGAGNNTGGGNGDGGGNNTGGGNGGNSADAGTVWRVD